MNNTRFSSKGYKRPGTPIRTIVSRWLPALISLSSGEETESPADELCRTLKEAIRAFGKHANQGRRRSGGWWTLECKAAHFQYRSAFTEPEKSHRAKVLRSTVAAEKKNYWKSQVEEVTSSGGACMLVRWGAPKHAEIDAMFCGGKRASGQAGLAGILRGSTLVRHQAADDLPSFPLAGEARIPLIEELDENEVWTCIMGSGNLCPGSDGNCLPLQPPAGT